MNYLDVEDLEVYKKLCLLHIDVCYLIHNQGWPISTETEN